eukprot:5968455-Prymnesium_polylepis.1
MKAVASALTAGRQRTHGELAGARGRARAARQGGWARAGRRRQRAAGEAATAAAARLAHRRRGRRRASSSCRGHRRRPVPGPASCAGSGPRRSRDSAQRRPSRREPPGSACGGRCLTWRPPYCGALSGRPGHSPLTRGRSTCAGLATASDGPRFVGASGGETAVRSCRETTVETF